MKNMLDAKDVFFQTFLTFEMCVSCVNYSSFFFLIVIKIELYR